MKFFRSLVLAASLSLCAFGAHGQAPIINTDALRAATLAVYSGADKCEFATVEGFLGEPEQEWGCKFHRRFTCTGTVIKQIDENEYVGLTAGHCFDREAKDKYYVSDVVAEEPVLHKITLVKFENDDRYDYAVFTFHSLKSFPAIPIAPTVDPQIESPVFNVNFAFGLVKQTTRGIIVSSIITSPANIGRDGDTKGRFLVSIGIGPGASGSAVVDEKTGEIIGIVEAMFPGTQMPTVVMPTGQSLLNFLEDDSAGIEHQAAPPPPAQAPIKDSWLVKLEKWCLKLLRGFYGN